jgi:hypothetical protein
LRIFHKLRLSTLGVVPMLFGALSSLFRTRANTSGRILIATSRLSFVSGNARDLSHATLTELRSDA